MWTHIRAVLVTLGVVHNSVELLAGGHAAVIFDKCRGSEPHAGSPHFAVLVFNAPSVGMARAPDCTLTAPSFTTAGQTPSAAPKSTDWGRAPCVMVPIVAMFPGRWERETGTRFEDRHFPAARNGRGTHLSIDQSVAGTRPKQFRDDESGTI
jgi:hypothetical protein